MSNPVHSLSPQPVGWEVINPSGELLGTISQLLAYSGSERLTCAIVAMKTGFLNIGVKYFAIPLSLLLQSERPGRMVLNATDHELDEAPPYNKDALGKALDPRYLDEAFQHYNCWE